MVSGPKAFEGDTQDIHANKFCPPGSGQERSLRREEKERTRRALRRRQFELTTNSLPPSPLVDVPDSPPLPSTSD